MPTFPGDRFPLPQAEIDFRRRQAQAPPKKKVQQPAEQAAPANGRPGSRKRSPERSTDEAMGLSSQKKLEKLRAKERALLEKARNSKVKSPRLEEAPDRKEKHRSPTGSKRSRGGSVHAVSGGLPGQGKRR